MLEVCYFAFGRGLNLPKQKLIIVLTFPVKKSTLKSFLGCQFYNNTRKNLKLNLVLVQSFVGVLVLVLESSLEGGVRAHFLNSGWQSSLPEGLYLTVSLLQ